MGTNATTYRTASNRRTTMQGSKVLNQVTLGYEVETHYSKNRLNRDDETRTEISLVRTLIHEAVHAKIALTPEVMDDDSHNKYSEYQTNVFNALVEYNTDNKLGYSEDELEAISWGGATDSSGFKNYIDGIAKKNGSTYEEEYKNWVRTANNIEYKKNDTDEQ